MLKLKLSRIVPVLLGLAVIAGAATTTPVPARAQSSQESPSDEPTTWRGRDLVGPSDEEFERARNRIDRLDDRIAATEDELERIEQEIVEVEEELQRATDELLAAQEVADLATEAADAARADLERVQGQLDAAHAALSENEEALAARARSAYMNGPGAADPVLIMLEGLNREDGSGSPADAQAAVDAIVRGQTKVLEDSEDIVTTMAALEEEVALRKQARADKEAEAEAARTKAAEQHARVLELLDETEAKLDRQRELRRSLGNDREEAVGTLEDLEAKAEEARKAAEAKRRYEREQRRKAEAARRAAARAAAEEKARKEAAAKRAAEEAAKARREAEAAEKAADEAERDADENRVDVSVSGNLATVGGITVAASIADELAALLSDARAAGIVLGGHGYRSIETTIALRIANGCPDVWNSPPSACRVPTARPGTSMHEKGLAIDFTYQGATICFPRPGSQCHGNAGFDWLRANAGRYGFRNLDSEAWHWSTNGR